MTRFGALEQVLTAAEAVLSAREDQMLTHVEWDALNDAVRNARGKTTYLVATLARYVLVEAENEEAEREWVHAVMVPRTRMASTLRRIM